MPTLDALVPLVPGSRLIGDGDVQIDDLAYDSGGVRPGSLFFCVRGTTRDGHDFAPGAVASGAAALVVERPLDLDVPQLVVGATREAMGAIAAPFFGEPSAAMSVIGVTGTNGKTTTTYLLEAVARAQGRTPGLLGTVACHIGDRIEPVAFTTPESIDLQRLLARMVAAGVDQVAMEVSSHGLAYGRVTGTRFAAAIFTNISRDHLDLHGSMDAYFEAKASLFAARYTPRAAINVGDPAGARLRAMTDVDVVTYGADDADVRVLDARLDGEGSEIEVDAAGRRFVLRTHLPGPYNITNALGVVAAGVALGWDLEAVAAGIASLRGVPGRLERIDAGQDFTVLVDYAHTPDALDNVLRAARAIVPEGGRLIAVFGCGGDRDPGKRPEMGRVATALADHTYITSDNPRSEEPAAIVRAIEAGARGPYTAIVDRREAIEAAVAGAGAGDVIVIAGKGHETGQKFADRTVPFDDRIVAREALEARA